MKTILIFILALLLFGCSSVSRSIKENETMTITERTVKVTPAPIKDTAKTNLKVTDTTKIIIQQDGKPIGSITIIPAHVDSTPYHKPIYYPEETRTDIQPAQVDTTVADTSKTQTITETDTVQPGILSRIWTDFKITIFVVLLIIVGLTVLFVLWKMKKIVVPNL